MKGFTFFEIIIVIAIIVFLMILVLPTGVRFYKAQQLASSVDEIIQALRRAQSKSMSVQNDSTFGVYFGSGQTGYYVLFRGNSYQSRSDQELFDIPNDISFGGNIFEVVFSKLEGVPNVTGALTLTLGAESKTITINEVGRINLE